ncbi:MAG TPA: glycerophosphodiester phosphodiesterase family protein, partial [Pirellulaceae bacterium]|nr:glycerophosphodiester phosphodiesterase family protein [Pirellulaceae bacterium]
MPGRVTRRELLRTTAAAGLATLAPSLPAAEDRERRTFVVGHRGLLHSAPENTLAAFRGCLALRVGFEFDVRRTNDGQLVCLHDATLDRTTSGTGRLADRTLNELRRLDAGSWFDDSFHGERVPTVNEVLALVAERATDSTFIAVDLKETGHGID